MITKKEFISRVEEIRTAVAVDAVAYSITNSLFTSVFEENHVSDMVSELKKDLGLDPSDQILEKFFWDKKFIGSYSKLYKKIKIFLDTNKSSFRSLNILSNLCFNNSLKSGWYSDLSTGQRIIRNRGEQLMLIVSEIAEAMEGERKDLQDDHLPHRSMAEVELADAMIRIFDYCGAYGYDLSGAVEEKISYNKGRADHKIENRIKEMGKSW